MALRQKQIVTSRLYKPLLPFFILPIRARRQKSPSSIIPRQTIHSIIASLLLLAILQTRTVPRPRRLGRLRHRLECVIEAAVVTGLMAWAPLSFMTVMMVWIMVFRIARFMPRQMQIRLCTLAGGIHRITVSTLVFTFAFIIPMATTLIMDT